MKTAKSREAYCSMASIRYAKVLFDLEVSEEAIMAATCTGSSESGGDTGEEA